MNDDPDNLEPDPAPEARSANTGQIPLLDDVVLDSELPFKPKSPLFQRPKPRPVISEAEHPEVPIPRATDLFGGSKNTAAEGPFSAGYDAQDLDQIREASDQVVDHLVKEYPVEVISQLRDDLTALLEDLNAPEKGPDQT